MNANLDASLSALRALRDFKGREGEFWLSMATHISRLFQAERVVLLRRAEVGWNPLSFWPLASARSAIPPSAQLAELATTAKQTAVAYAPLPEQLGTTLQHAVSTAAEQSSEKKADNISGNTLLAFHLHTESADGEIMALLWRAHDSAALRNGDLLKRELLVDLPLQYRQSNTTRPLTSATPESLDVVLSMNEHTTFTGAAMSLCNELAFRLSCSRVSIGWKDGEYIRLQAVSHTEKFDRKMSVARALEVVMEECFDQDEELLVPEVAGTSTTIIREHRAFVAKQGVGAILSLPLRLGNEVVAVLSCERDKPFSADDIRSLRIICDQVTRRLGDLKHFDRWFGAVALDKVRNWASSLIGTDKTVHKIYAVVGSILLLFLLFGKMEYKVEAPFILRTHDLALLSAPFDGYIERVSRKPGDLVTTGDPLILLDTRQLLLEESRSAADVLRYQQEEKKAMAQNALAEMKVAEALRRQADSRYQMIRYNLQHADIRAPFSGIVVEGDLEKLLGAPVRKGDVLLKVAKLEKLYIEIKVAERDIQEFKVGQEGEVAFISQPSKKYTVVVDRIEPMAVTEQKGNVFLVLGHITEARDAWWRPGMSGLAKVSVGERHILWIWLHRTLDFFSMKLWW